MEIEKVLDFIALVDKLGDHLSNGRHYRIEHLVRIAGPLAVAV